ncbi:MAG: tetratricopeptide repeat protein [bacterium]|nr:tetratricopeptide repeat protein [bacterium]
MKIKRVIIIAIALLFALDLMGAVLGKMRVTVKDSEGKPVPGVKITLEDTGDSAVVYHIATRKSGVAVQVGLKNHIFRVTLEKEGYQPIKKDVKIPAGLMQDESFTLLTVKEVIKEQTANDPKGQAIDAFNEAGALIKDKKYDEAIEMLKKSISLDDSIFQSHYYSGVVYFEQGKYREAVKPLLKAIELKDDDARVYRLLAAVYEKLGNKKEVEKYTKLAQEKGGKTAIDAYNEGIHAFNSGETDKAVTALLEAVKLDEKFGEAYYRLGLSYLNKGDNAKAIEAFKKYLEVEPAGKEAETVKAIIDSLK